MPKYAESTDVSSYRSREEIERLLTRNGAEQIIFGVQSGKAILAFAASGRQVRFILPLPNRNDPEIKRTPERGTVRSRDAQEKAYEQAVRQKWRALAISIKAKFAAIEAGISIFEREFFYDTVLPGGQTVGEYMLPQIQKCYESGTMPDMLPLLGTEAQTQ